MNLGLKYVGKLKCICASVHFSKELKLDALQYGGFESLFQYQLLLFVELGVLSSQKEASSTGKTSCLKP